MYFLQCILFAFKINQFFSLVFDCHRTWILTKSREFEFPGLAFQCSPYSSARTLQRLIKVHSFVIPVYVNPLHSGAFVAYSGVPVRCGVIPAPSGIFWYYSCPFRFILASYYVPLYSVPVFSDAPFFLNLDPKRGTSNKWRHFQRLCATKFIIMTQQIWNNYNYCLPSISGEGTKQKKVRIPKANNTTAGTSIAYWKRNRSTLLVAQYYYYYY